MVTTKRANNVDGVRCADEARAVPELLAPAGNRDAFLAALAAGADAIYLGVEDFNARRNADNFNFDTLPEACELAHLAGRRVYLTLNTAVLPQEMAQALKVAEQAWDCGIDALIVSDLGLLARLAAEMPGFELHFSTQMNIHSADGLRLAAELGASRVTLARELSLPELARLAASSVPLEVFAHGALCVCYSGQCLFSSLVGRRSANRGLCAQACRLPYQLIDSSTGRRIKTPGEHLLSPADLATIDILPELCASGVAALKLEGRMKSAAYVGTVTRVYREALDNLQIKDSGTGGNAGRAGQVGDSRAGDSRADGGGDLTHAGHREQLTETFSRGFTTAYLSGERGNAMMSYTRPNNQGVAIGRVAGFGDGQVTLALTKRVAQGDVLEIRTRRGRSTVKLDEFWDVDGPRSASGRPGAGNEHKGAGGAGGNASAGAGAAGGAADGASGASGAAGGAADGASGAGSEMRIRLRLTEPVSIGDRVFRLRNSELIDAAKSGSNSLFQGNNGLVGLVARVVARIGRPLEIGFSLAAADSGRADVVVTLSGDVVQPARTKALAADDLREHAGRVGGTVFRIDDWDIQLDEGVGMGFSQLHALRAEALEQLRQVILDRWQQGRLEQRQQLGTRRAGGSGSAGTAAGDAAGDDGDAGTTGKRAAGPMIRSWTSALAPARKGQPRVAAIVRTAAGAKAAKAGGAEIIYLHSLSFEAGEPPEAQMPKGLPIIRLLPAVSHQDELKALLEELEELEELPPSKGAGGRQSYVANNLGEIAALGMPAAANQKTGSGCPPGDSRPKAAICPEAALRLEGDSHFEGSPQPDAALRPEGDSRPESNLRLEGGPSLGICNGFAIDLLARLGIAQAWLSPELSYQDIILISPNTALPLALTVFGRQEMMVTEHCLLMAQGPCNQDCSNCSRRKAQRFLEDRKGYRFPILTDEAGRSHLFNSVALDLIPSMPELVSLGISTLAVDGTLLSTKELRAEVERCVRARDLAIKGAGSLPKREGYTTGHFFRGVY